MKGLTDADRERVTAAAAALRDLRQVAADLMSYIDTATLPKPDKVNWRPDDRAGPEWHPTRNWLIRTLDNDDVAGVFVDLAPWGQPDDWHALNVADARAIGMAFLAAADHAERQRTLAIAQPPKETTEP